MTTEQQCSDRRSDLYNVAHGKVAWKVFVYIIGGIVFAGVALAGILYAKSNGNGEKIQEVEVVVAKVEERGESMDKRQQQMDTRQQEMARNINQILQSVKD